MKMKGLREWGYEQGKTFAEKCLSRAAERYLNHRKAERASEREEFKFKLLVGTTVATAFIALSVIALLCMKLMGKPLW
jgi:hypothetical protein